MPTPKFTKRFRKDAELAKRRGKSTDKLQNVLEALCAGGTLDPRYRDHPLIGNFVGRRECHLEPDWLLVYKIVDDEIVFERTGTHADLFD